jgi:hypothetical protein
MPIWVDLNLDSPQQGDLDCGGPSTMGELVKDQVHTKELGNISGNHKAMALEQPPPIIALGLLVHLLHSISRQSNVGYNYMTTKTRHSSCISH